MVVVVVTTVSVVVLGRRGVVAVSWRALAVDNSPLNHPRPGLFIKKRRRNMKWKACSTKWLQQTSALPHRHHTPS